MRTLAQLITGLLVMLLGLQLATPAADSSSVPTSERLSSRREGRRPRSVAEARARGATDDLDPRDDGTPRAERAMHQLVTEHASMTYKVIATDDADTSRVVAPPAAHVQRPMRVVPPLERATPRQHGQLRAGTAASPTDTIPDRIKAAYASAVATLSAAPAVTYVVDDPGDAPDDSIADGDFFPRTLRSAIENANETPALDKIVFAPGITTISIGGTGGLFASKPVHIDGKIGTSDRVTLDGTGLAVGQPILWINSGGSTVQNLELTNGKGSGLQLGANGGITNVVRNCLIHANNGAGINMNFCSQVWIGGDTSGSGGNIVHGNLGTGGIGISLINANGNNCVVGNYVGTTDGVTASPNSRHGINLDASSNVVYDNLVSGNNRSGFELDNAQNNLVQANYIGTTADGLWPLGNGQEYGSDGMELWAASNDTIRDNTISGNTRHGISLAFETTNPIIERNRIGVDAQTLRPLGNWESGIAVNSFGGLIRDNVIGDNLHGILIQQDGLNVSVMGNVLGTTGTADSNFGNWSAGIRIRGSNNTIGSTLPTGRNLITDNSTGIDLTGTRCSTNVIVGNYIGVDEAGTGVLFNWADGIVITEGASRNQIKNNVISGNLGAGIWFTQRLDKWPEENEVLGNSIGADFTGTRPVPNNWSGIWIDYGRDNVIGGPDLEANTIVANDSGGIFLGGGISNEFYGNYIGTNSAGADSLGNRGYGILIDATRDTTVDSNQFGAPGTVLGNVIVSNDSAGVELRGSKARDNLFLGNLIGTLRDSTTRLPNAAGVVIDGAVGNEFGSTTSGGGNLIAGNTGDGIRVLAGERNSFRGNVIAANGGRGIDLGGDGITPNDSLDADTGPNARLNFPVVDSGYVNDTTSTSLYGTYGGRPDETFTLDFYLNTDCDSLRYGEGERWIDSVVATTDADGRASWQLQVFAILDSGNVLTMTATDSAGNTSEYSACWPFKVFCIRDFAGAGIPSKWFQLSRVGYDPPTFTEHPIDSFMTDLFGYIRLSAHDVERGDTVRIAKHVASFPSKKHGSTLGTRYSWHVDNIDYDSINFDVRFTEVDSALRQRVTVAQPLFAHSLLVSIEWDASPAFVSDLQTAFRRLSNYLYDVYDGQWRLDTIAIFDDRVQWDSADIQIHASNVEWPRATVLGVRSPQPWAHVTLPRTWWGGVTACRTRSAVEFPPVVTDPINYRTIGHELGHYLIGMYDEYQFPRGETRCGSIVNYGYMDYHYPKGGIPSSELSWSRQYADTLCRNNNQWRQRGKSCWDYIEGLEQVVNGMTLSVIEPGERPLNGADYFLGPNDDTTALDYEVSRFLTFTGTTDPYYTTPAYLTVTDLVGVGLDKIAVIHYRAAKNRAVVQGYSAPDGRLIALGVEAGDTIFAGGRPGVVTVDSTRTRRPAAGEFEWFYGLAAASGGGASRLGNRYAASAASDSITIQLQRVQGDYPLVISTDIGAADVSLAAEFANAFDDAPLVQVWPDGVLADEDVLSVVGDAYSTTLSSAAEDQGFMRFWAVDSTAQSYFFDVDYAVAVPDSIDSSAVVEVKARGGDAEFSVDTSAGQVERLTLVSSAYPVMRTGLPPNTVQAGRTQSVSTYPLTSYMGTGQIAIFFDDSDVKDSLSGWDLEWTLRMHRWNETQNQWELIGGYVDTALDFVSAAIDEPGVYAAFTTEVPCTIGMTGDVNLSGTIVSSDIVYLVNYIFKAGPEPLPCAASGDVNCDGEVKSSDIVYLVNYVLKAGAAPCDVCTLVPGLWPCP